MVGDAAFLLEGVAVGDEILATGFPLSDCCTSLVLAWCCTLSWASRNSSTASPSGSSAGSSSGLAMASLVGSAWRAGDGVA